MGIIEKIKRHPKVESMIQSWQTDYNKEGWSSRAYVPKELVKHMYVCGLSGMGKSTFIKGLLSTESSGGSEFCVPFLVIEPTRSQEYRRLRSVCSNRNFLVYTLGVDEGNKMDLNPFYIPYGMDFTGHIELLKSCFSDALTCKEPLVYQYLERAIPEVYFDKGWDRVTFTHPYLLSKDDYQSEEHWFYFPRMQDLYNKVVELSEKSEFTEGSENKGTIRELVKSNLRTFLSGPMGRSFNTYRNDLYDKAMTHNIVIEIPNTISTTLQAILNLLLGIVIEVIGSRKKSKNLSHITVFEEAQLLFNAEDDDKIHKTTARKLEYLLSTSRKFGESIIIANQDPKAIHRSVIGNIRNRVVFRINYSDVAEHIAKDFGCANATDLITQTPYKCYYKKEGQNLLVHLTEEEKKLEMYIPPKSSLKLNISCSGLDNFNEQLQIIETYIKNSLVGVNSLKNAMADCLKSQCNIDNLDLNKYLAYLTCICIANNRCRLVKGVYDQLTAYFKTPNAPLPKEFIESGILEESVIQRISKKMLDHDRCNNKR